MGNMEKNPSEMTINQAAKWYARLQSPDCSQADVREFQHWLEKNPLNVQAYESVRSAAQVISDKWASNPRMAALSKDALKVDAEKSKVSGTFFSGKQIRSLAAGFAFLGIFVILALSNGSDVAKTIQSQVYVNNSVVRQRVDLIDGSVIYLDVTAKVNVTISEDKRLVELKQGRALFEVAHDRSRPFSVTAMGSSVVALGTRFQVEMYSRAVDVVLTEGSVAVSGVSASNHWREVLIPGEKLSIDARLNSAVKTTVDAELLTGWTKGQLNFEGMPLVEVLEQVNRYSQIKVVLGDDTLASIPISGNFIAGGDSNEFVETLTSVLPLRSVRTGANEIVLFQTHELSSN
jgi:transmembrane sensor